MTFTVSFLCPSECDSRQVLKPLEFQPTDLKLAITFISLCWKAYSKFRNNSSSIEVMADCLLGSPFSDLATRLDWSRIMCPPRVQACRFDSSMDEFCVDPQPKYYSCLTYPVGLLHGVLHVLPHANIVLLSLTTWPGSVIALTIIFATHYF